MGEKYGDIKGLFDKNDRYVVIDAAKKQETRNLIKRQEKEQRNFVSANKWQMIKMQVCYMDKTILLVHLAACFGTVILGNSRNWEQISMIVASALGALSLLEVGNMFYSGMTEIGESCYFNVRQLAAFQMVYSGLFSLAALLLATVSASLKYQLHIMKTGIYILVPFVFTECICMTVMLMETGRRNLLFFVAAGVFSALFWSVLASIPSLYAVTALALWGLALIVGIGIFVVLIRRFFNALDKGELLCAD